MGGATWCLVLVSAITGADQVNFSRDILPILSDNCFHCHGPDEKKREAELRLDTEAAALRKENPLIVPGKSAESALVKRILSPDPDEQMPPPSSNRKLTPAQIVLLQRWIDEGAKWGKHWAYEKPVRPPLPATLSPQFSVQSPVDRFIQARLAQEQLSPTPEAPRRTLIRRLTLDLIGLPPTPEEVAGFVSDPAPDVYERLADRLFASPRYGERMAWEWLDAARYADSNGYQGDGERTMWPWRDWVVRALNANMPYDQFTLEQLAGDLLPNPTLEQKIATGFNRNHMINGEGGRIAEENRIEYLFDQTETLATVWLGLTFTCCRCHSHKYDPFTQHEYYQLFAYFNRTPVSGGDGSGQAGPNVEFFTPSQEQRRQELQAAVEAFVPGLKGKEEQLSAAAVVENDGKPESSLPQPVQNAWKKSPAERSNQEFDELTKHFKETEKDYVAQLGELRKVKETRDNYSRSLPRVMVMQDVPQPRETFLLVRGQYNKTEDKVAPGVPAALSPLPADSPTNRLGLAQWLIDPAQPLTARVTVNRQWQTFFGRGLVKSAEDFGVQGEKPSHPELLDWLAVEFREGPGSGNWDVKRLQRLLISSATYRQTSSTTPAVIERDPENKWLARGARFRLPSWMLRDQALAASGLIVSEIGGPSVKPYQPEGVWEEATFGNKRYQNDSGASLYRRSAYTFWRRIVGPTMFFDSAARQTCSVKQSRTNTPLHALATLNDITYVEAARALAEKLLSDANTTPEQRIAQACEWILARPSAEQEVTVLRAALDKFRTQFAADPESAKKLLVVGDSPRNASLDPVELAAYATLVNAIFNLDEALTKE